MTLSRHVIALEEFAAPLGSLVHAVNNSLGAIVATTYALEMEGSISGRDAHFILVGVEAAQARCVDFAPIVSARSDPAGPWTASLPDGLSGTVSALSGRPIAVAWVTGIPRARDVRASARKLVASLWTAASELTADRVLIACEVRNGRLAVVISTPSGEAWGPVDIGEAAE